MLTVVVPARRVNVNQLESIVITAGGAVNVVGNGVPQDLSQSKALGVRRGPSRPRATLSLLAMYKHSRRMPRPISRPQLPEYQGRLSQAVGFALRATPAGTAKNGAVTDT